MTIEDTLRRMADLDAARRAAAPAIAAFVARVSRLPIVEQVLVDGDSNVLTIIAAPPLDNDAYYPVIHLEHGVLDEFGAYLVNFDIININDYEDGIAMRIPSGMWVVFEKKRMPV